MILYRYRTIQNALLEIENGTFYFSPRDELNDPLEGYVRVFWQGDKAAWEGLMKYYICSVYQAIEMYLLQCNEGLLHQKSLIIDLHRFDNVPLGKILKELGEAFLRESIVQEIAEYYGNNDLKVLENELRFIFRLVHIKAVRQCIKVLQGLKTIPEEEAARLLKLFEIPKESSLHSVLKTNTLLSSRERAVLFQVAEETASDLFEYQFILKGIRDGMFLYGKKQNENEEIIETDKEAYFHRNWMAIAIDFPKIYVEQLKNVIYPNSFIVCFSTKNDDSAMWGNYAESHKGVCLVYETDTENHIVLDGKQKISLVPKAVKYHECVIERNFFISLGGLTYSQYKSWLTGSDGVSSYINTYKDTKAWREKYWDDYETKTYNKLIAWEHEAEYRIDLSNAFYSYQTPDSRILKYDPKYLKGVIFGIKTSEYDKMRILKLILEQSENLVDFSFYQAEYDDEKETITVRKKNFWNLNICR